MILTDSTAARVQGSTVTGIISVSSSFLQFMQYAAITVSTAISGTIGIVKNGIGGLTFSGACTYTGPTQINGGQIVISGTVASTLNGVISGTGYLTKTGTGNLTLGGNNTYSGGTVFSPSSGTATIIYSSSNAFGTGLFTAQGNCQIVTGGNVTLPNDFQINTGTTLQYRTSGANTITVTGNIAGSGGINKTGNGVINLTAATLTYTGSTNRQAGFIVASKTTGASTATATFTTGLSVSFNVAPTAGMTFRFFAGSTTNTYASVTLVGAPGRTGTYNSANSTLTIA